MVTFAAGKKDMKKKDQDMVKKFFKRLYGWSVVPAVLLHEASHVLVGRLVGMRFSWEGSEFVWMDDELSFDLVPKNKRWTELQLRTVPMAPLVPVVLVALAAGLVGGAFWGCTLLYAVYSWGHIIPSSKDISLVMDAKAYARYDTDSEVLYRFLRMKHPADPDEISCVDI